MTSLRSCLQRAATLHQLGRAASSVAFNIAECAAEFSPREKMRSYRIARRSAGEALAVLNQVEHVLGGHPLIEPARHELDVTVALLTNMMRSLEKTRIEA